MSLSRFGHRWWLLVTLACSGAVLVYAPKLILEQYEAVAKLGPTWTYIYFGVVGTGAALLLGTTLWIVFGLWRRTVRKRKRQVERNRSPSEMTDSERLDEVRENIATVDAMREDDAVSPEVRAELEPLVRRVQQKQERQTLEIVAFGTISSGKSSLLNALAGRDLLRTDPKGGTTLRRNEIPWPGDDRVLLVDTPGLGEVDGEPHMASAMEAARDADVVLLVVDGPLRESEFVLLERLARMEKRLLLCLNKGDWYNAEEQRYLLDQLCGQVARFVAADDVVAVRAEPARRVRVRRTASGEETAEEVESPPDIGQLAERLLQVIRRDGRDLLMANLLLKSRGLVEEARQRVEEALDRRAWEIVDRYSWGAAGAAALSPLPLLDLAAGGALTTKMVFDLAKVYRQEIAADTVVQLLGQLGKNLVAILGVSAATPAVASAIGSLLKTVPGVGTIAGGVLQGAVQAIVTRWIGSVFIHYFKNEMKQPEGGMAGLARREWDRLTTLAEMRQLVRSARDHFSRHESEAAR